MRRQAREEGRVYRLLTEERVCGGAWGCARLELARAGEAAVRRVRAVDWKALGLRAGASFGRAFDGPLAVAG
jgi:hypothetical protein